MVGPRSRRGRAALALAALGGVVLVVSAFSSWTQPATIARPSYTDGVPNAISHPSDLAFRLGAAALGVVALALVARSRRRARHLHWAVLAALGLGGLALGIDALQVVEHQSGFGSLFVNDMSLGGFRHGALNYVELAGASLLCVSPLAAVRATRR
jgi:hypothetical protein